ncbi:MAG: hypothetical protein B193_3522 [Solidesulfovibrio magneticus str. Maddingley MBC34]|uniref:Uncharacterized protein n=1 Tax=Solidesulfovibrio magneticus str. Maddingley MBC34 TaxID=1206767 RepID=K6H5L3_9BACT|nr:MAG: hypothetical protein B193_3522 [Solidesulfovibrio magneticus str. Maddingley MBC34]
MTKCNTNQPIPPSRGSGGDDPPRRVQGRALIFLFLIPLAVVAAFALLSWRGILWTPGHVYQNWDRVPTPYAEEMRQVADISKHAWASKYDMGAPGAFSGITRWFDLVTRDAGSYLGGPFIVRWEGPVYAVAGAGGVAALCRLMGLGLWPTILAAMIFAFNPRQFSMAVAGHVEESGFALAIVPWVLVLLFRAAADPSKRRFLACTLTAGLLGALACSASPFGIVFYGSFTALFTLGQTVARRSARPALAFALAGGVALFLHLHWLVPAASSIIHAADFKHHQTKEEINDHYQGIYRRYSAPLRQAMLGHTDNYGMGTEYAYPVTIKDNPEWVGAALALLGLAILGGFGRVPNKGVKYFAALCLLMGFICLAGNKTLAGAVFYEKFLNRVPILFFQMARPARWLPVYYFGLALLAGLGLARLLDWSKGSRLNRATVLAFAAAILAVYLHPYWTGQLTRPQNATSQTMAMMPQPLSPAEGTLSKYFTNDPDDYRVTVWPTIAGPTGDVPEPPDNGLTRNFALLGKDGVIGPTYIGEPYSMYLLGLLHRPWPVTDAFGRLLGLAAVKRVIYNQTNPYLSYGSFGWMPTTKRGPETLFDPGDLIGPFIAAQRDLVVDPDLAAPPEAVYRNTDFLPRLRLTKGARLAAGGFPLLLSLANASRPDWADEALFFGADVTEAELKTLGPGFGGLTVAGGATPELLLPFLPANAYDGAASATLEGSFGPLAPRQLDDPRHGGSVLEKAARVSEAPGVVRFALIGHGTMRLFLRAGAESFAGTARVSLDGAPVAELVAGQLGRGIDWIDCGTATFEPGPPHELAVDIPGRGVIVSGLLAVPEEAYEAARDKLAALAGGKVRVVAEAEEATVAPVAPMAPKLFVPLMAQGADLTVASENARLDLADPRGAGVVAVEGDAPGEVVYTVRFPEPVSGLTLESYPRLFGDKVETSYVAASVSVDGGPSKLLYRVEGSHDDRWEDVYKRRVVSEIKGPATTVTIRFAMRQAQLSSQVNSPNQPMRLVADTPVPGRAVLSFGAAARLPATLAVAVPVAGDYAATLRLVGKAGDTVRLPDGRSVALAKDGRNDVPAGTVRPGDDGLVRLALDGPAAVACDAVELTLGEAGGPAAGADIAYKRQNAGRYDLTLPAGGGFLVFSEAFHPGWGLIVGGKSLPPLKGLGFINVYHLPSDASGPAELLYRDEAIMAKLVPVMNAGWIVLTLMTLGLFAPDLLPGRRKAPRVD